jgi:hypothetical protein
LAASAPGISIFGHARSIRNLMELSEAVLDVSTPSSEQAQLFSPLRIRDIVFRNRIAVLPKCQYSSEDGFANDWHFVHLGSRAVGGAALVMAEASAVEARGRISPADLGIWKDEHIQPWHALPPSFEGREPLPAFNSPTQDAKPARTCHGKRVGHSSMRAKAGGAPSHPAPSPFGKRTRRRSN